MSELTLHDIVLFQAGYGFNIVLASSLCLGISAALVGCFFYLRKDILLADALSHATLPGVGLGFLAALGLGLDHGRNPLFLMAGAFGTALLGTLSVQWIVRHTRLRYDVAIASVLSVFYGGGVVLLSVIQRLENAAQAGLGSVLLGQIAGMNVQEAVFSALLSVAVILCVLLYFRDFLLCAFDPDYAFCIGRPTDLIHRILLILILAIICIGLKTVGLILILALLVMPAAIARFWSARMAPFMGIACGVSALACYGGTVFSALYSNIPTGSTIVLCFGFMLAVSLIFGTDKGLVAQWTKS